MTKDKKTGFQTSRGWAISILLEAGAIRECDDHGWMQDRTDPHARERAIDIARSDPPADLAATAAVAAIRKILDTIGENCPECSSD